MAIDIHPLHPVFVGEVSGADLSQTLTPANVAAIEAGMDRYGVLVFHGQDITDEQQVAFSRNFGEIELAVGGNVTQAEERRLPVEIADVSNLDQNNQVLARDDRRRMFNLGNQLWHSDSSFRAVPAKYSLLSGRRVQTSVGNTEFCDMRAAYDDLDAATKLEIEDLITEHSLIYSRGILGFGEYSEAEMKMFTPVRQRLVRTHRVTGRKSLYLASHAGEIEDLPRPEALMLLRELTEHATQREFVYSHKWRVGDLIMWDNRTTMHRATRYDDLLHTRDLRRTTVTDGVETIAQAA